MLEKGEGLADPQCVLVDISFPVLCILEPDSSPVIFNVRGKLVERVASDAQVWMMIWTGNWGTLINFVLDRVI